MAKKTQRAGASYKNFYKGYAATGQKLKNKIRKLKKHCKKFVNDTQSANVLRKLNG